MPEAMHAIASANVQSQNLYLSYHHMGKRASYHHHVVKKERKRSSAGPVSQDDLPDSWRLPSQGRTDCRDQSLGQAEVQRQRRVLGKLPQYDGIRRAAKLETLGAVDPPARSLTFRWLKGNMRRIQKAKV